MRLGAFVHGRNARILHPPTTSEYSRDDHLNRRRDPKSEKRRLQPQARRETQHDSEVHVHVRYSARTRRGEDHGGRKENRGGVVIDTAGYMRGIIIDPGSAT